MPHTVRSEIVEELRAAAPDEDARGETPRLLRITAWRSGASACSSRRSVREDADGDLELPRKKRRPSRRRDVSSASRASGDTAADPKSLYELDTLSISTGDATGTQIWRASLLLGEYVESQQTHFRDTTVLELGCGVGLVAIVAARFARVVYATDGDTDALEVCRRNAERNASAPGRLRVHHLQWRGHEDKCFDPEAATTPPLAPAFDWILASDVFYDDDVADLFLDTLHDLMRRHPTARVAVAAEKRTVFSAVTLSEISLGYDALQLRLCKHEPTHHSLVSPNGVRCAGCAADALEDRQCKPRFVATSVPIDSIARVYNYDRVSTLLLWELQAVVPATRLS